MAAENFSASLAATLKHEGGWSDHPRDPGGATMKGITLATYRLWHSNPRLKADDLRAIPKAEVQAIYEAMYWNAVQGDELPHGIDHMVFDMAVNAGVRRSSLQLQTAIGMSGRDLDGVIGPRTLEATRTQDYMALINTLADLHERHYRSLSTFDAFGRGWLRRLAQRVAHARNLVGEAEA